MPDRLNKLFLVLDVEMKAVNEWKATDDISEALKTFRRILFELCAEVYK